MKYIDLTHTFTDDMPVYPGDPKSELKQIATLAKDGFTDHEIKSGMHVGTHMDAPIHMLPDSARLSEISVDRFFGKGRIIDARNQDRIGRNVLTGNIGKGDIVLFYTGWSKKYRDADYYEGFPQLTEDCAHELVQRGVSAIGLDTPSPDWVPFPIHKILLKGDVLIIENLTNLQELLTVKEFEIIALPAKFDTDGAPIRVVARVSE